MFLYYDFLFIQRISSQPFLFQVSEMPLLIFTVHNALYVPLNRNNQAFEHPQSMQQQHSRAADTEADATSGPGVKASAV